MAAEEGGGVTEGLDQVRGVLASLANRGTPLLQPVSTHAISAALKRRNRELDSRSYLDRLSRVGDVQPLRGGLWVPCSTTLVRCAGLLVAVSGLPTPRLKVELSADLLAIGDSRIVANSSLSESDVRYRDFNTWCAAPECSRSWSESVIADAQYSQAPLVEGMEWHDHWSAGLYRRWSELHADVEFSHGPALGRLRSRLGSAEYFLLRRNSAGWQMAVLSKEDGAPQRLRYALLASAGNPTHYRAEKSEDGSREIVVPRILPSAEGMVLAALGSAHAPPDAWQQVFRIPEAAWPQIEQMFEGLGLVRSDTP